MSEIDNLLQVMRDLRHPENGCPWDIRQTSATIAPHTLDETHELLDAIERDDTGNLKEELGDLLFNIVFHARIAEENGQFDFDDVVRGITGKMLRRHPHVFGADRGKTISDEVLSQQWQALKQLEKGGNEDDSIADDNASNSAIFRARQLQKHAALSGFDWPDLVPVFDKLEEEVAELRQALDSGDDHAIAGEVGDIMFVCVNIARHAKINTEMALRRTNRKFVRRFAYVQQKMTDAGLVMEQGQLEQMERFWQESKNIVG